MYEHALPIPISTEVHPTVSAWLTKVRVELLVNCDISTYATGRP